MEGSMFPAAQDTSKPSRVSQLRLAWIVGMGIWAIALGCLAVFF
jgi:hypothetical protein